MIKVNYLFNDYDYLWAELIEDGRIGYYFLDSTSDFTVESNYQEVETYLNNKGVHINNLPHIENASESLQYMYNELVTNDSLMFFLDNDNIDNISLPILEFIEQVDTDIKKYKLSDVIEKGVDDTVYTCYSGLLAEFTRSR